MVKWIDENAEAVGKIAFAVLIGSILVGGVARMMAG